MEDNYLKCGAKKKFFVFNLEKLENGTIHDQDRMNILYGLGIIRDALENYHEILEKEYLVINTDEEYSDQVIDIMKSNNHFG